MSDTPIRTVFAPAPGSTLPITRAEYVAGVFANVADHAARDVVLAGVARVGTLVRTLNDNIVWEVKNVGPPIVWAPWTPVSAILAFDTIASAIAFDFTAFPNGTIAAMVQPDDLYELLTVPGSAIIAATDGVSIIQPVAPNTARLIRKGLSYSYIPDIYVNGGTAGDDSKDGSLGHPIKTLEEWAARMFPKGTKRNFKQPTTLHVAAGTYPVLRANLDEGSSPLTVVCESSDSANITLNTVTNTVPGITTVGSGIRGQVSTLSGTFAVGQMLRCVSGSHVGAVAYVMKLGVDAQHAFVSHWHVNTLGYRATQVNLANGDVVVVVTNLVDITTVKLSTGEGVNITVQHLGTTWTSGCSLEVHDKNFAGVRFDCCQGFFSSFTGANFARSQGHWFSLGGSWSFQGGNHWKVQYIAFSGYSTSVSMVGGDCVSDAGFQNYGAHISLGFDLAGGTNFGGLEFEDCGSAGCLSINYGGTFQVTAELPIWGVTGAPSGVGVSLVNGNFLNTQTQRPTINAAIQASVGGKSYTYAQMPIVDKGSDSCFLTTVSTDASFYVASRNTLIAATNLYAVVPPKGQYVLSATLTVKTAGTAGSFAVFATWVDATGVTQHVRITAYMLITAIDDTFGSIQIRTDGATHIQYSVEQAPGVYTQGSLDFELSLSCERKAVS